MSSAPIFKAAGGRFALLVAAGACLFVAAAASIAYGTAALSWAEIFKVLTGSAEAPEAARLIVVDIRLPRLLLVGLCGCALAIAGAVLQGMFRNPLVDPSLLGVSSGGGLAVAVVTVFGLAGAWGSLILPVAAFAGGSAAAFIVYRIAHRGGRTNTVLLLLAGIAVNALASAAIGFVTFVSDDAELRSFLFWMLGSFSDATWNHVPGGALFMLFPVIVLMMFARGLNALSLGDADAACLGFEVERMKRIIIVCAVLCVGTSVAIAGIISFVGLVVPHVMRLLIGSDHRCLLPATALGGALLLVAADFVAKLAFQPAELPIGVLTALIGAPFFVALIVAKQRTVLS